jgi:excisionase family DNA binding protein
MRIRMIELHELSRLTTVTPEETAAILRIARSKVYDDLASGALPGWKIGKRWIVSAPLLYEMIVTAGGRFPKPVGSEQGAGAHDAA